MTDASYCSRTRCAAWAAWAESGRGRFFGGGVIAGNTTNNNTAEMHAVALGLRIAVERGIFMAPDHIALQTDSEHVAKRLHPGYRSKRQRWRERRGLPEPERVFSERALLGDPRALFFHLIHSHGLRFSITRSNSGAVMDWVDQRARQWMLEERELRLSAEVHDALTLHMRT